MVATRLRSLTMSKLDRFSDPTVDKMKTFWKCVFVVIFCCVTYSLATVFSDTFDTATPAGGDSPTEADDRMREIKAAVQERENVDHYWPLTGTEVSDADAGEHRKVTYHTTIADPTPVASHAHLYMQADELRYQNDVDAAFDLTNAGGFAGGTVNGNRAITGTLDVTGATELIGIATIADDSVTKTVAVADNPAEIANLATVDAQIAAGATPVAAICKGWVQHNSAGVKQGTGLNITSTAKTATGEYTVTWDTDFANDNYACVITPVNASTDLFATIETHAVGSVHYRVSNDSGGSTDAACHVIVFGDQ